MFNFLMLTAFITFSFSVFAREVVIISDLDETLRKANVEHHLKAAGKLIEGVKPYAGAQIIFNELAAKNPEAKFYYLSNSYSFLYNGTKWTSKHGFPAGKVYQRGLKDKSKSFKLHKLKEIAKNHAVDAEYIFFGDNVERDPQFYAQFISEAGLNNARVFIRDARLIFPSDSNAIYYQHEAQITDDLQLSQNSVEVINKLFFNYLVPPYLMNNLHQRLVKECKLPRRACQDEADETLADVRVRLEVKN